MFLVSLKCFCRAVVVLVVIAQSSADAANYFVSSRSGDDNQSPRNARSPETPWRTIQHAVDMAKPGETIIVLPGRYNEHVQFRTSGTADKPITLIGRHYGRARIIGSVSGIGVAHIRVSGLDISNSVLDPNHPPTTFDPKGLYFYYAHHIQLTNNIVRDCRGGGIGLVNTDEVSVCDNIVYNNAAGFDGSHSGISVYQPLNYTGEHGDGPGTIICRNLVFNNSNSQFLDDEGNPKEITDGHGIIIDDTMATQRENFEADLEYFWSVAPDAPAMPIDWQSPYTRSILIDSNVCHSNGGSGVSLFICERVVICNNTCLLNQRNLFDVAEINLGGASEVLVQNNLMVSPIRQRPAAGQASTDFRQAAKLSDNVKANDRSTIIWTANALHDSVTRARGLVRLHDSKSIALNAPRTWTVNPITGSFNLDLEDQVRDRGTPVASPLSDFRCSPRVQGASIDIGAIEAADPPLQFSTPEEEAAYRAQLELQRVRETQLPRFSSR